MFSNAYIGVTVTSKIECNYSYTKGKLILCTCQEKSRMRTSLALLVEHPRLSWLNKIQRNSTKLRTLGKEVLICYWKSREFIWHKCFGTFIHGQFKPEIILCYRILCSVYNVLATCLEDVVNWNVFALILDQDGFCFYLFVSYNVPVQHMQAK